MSRTIPPLLEPYLRLPEETAQIVLTGVLGAKTNWLVLRYLYSLLKASSTTASANSASSPPPPPLAQQRGIPLRPAVARPAVVRPGGLRAPVSEPEPSVHDGGEGGESGAEEVSVLLVSFMRNFAFWKEGAGRLGLDLEALGRRGRFGFVDGLCGETAASATTPPVDKKWKRGLSVTGTGRGGVMEEVKKVLNEAVDGLLLGVGRRKKVVLVIDQLDFLVASSSSPQAGLELKDILLDLRENVHATILTLAADDPLLLPAAGSQSMSGSSSISTQCASFVLSLAHEASIIISLRLLDTGMARDVSGVVRITRGGTEVGESLHDMEEHEYLYQVGDNGVRVFERGQ